MEKQGNTDDQKYVPILLLICRWTTEIMDTMGVGIS